MHRVPAPVLLSLIAALGATPACFPNFEETADGGPNGSAGGDDGGAKHDATVSGGDDGGTVVVVLPDGGTVVVLPDGAPIQEDGGPVPPGPDGGPAPSVDGGVYVPPGTFTFLFSNESETPSTTASFSHGFFMDVTEVTVAEFTAWVNGGRVLPKDGQTLDPGGPYQNQMYWQAAWNNTAAANDFTPTAGTCTTADDLFSLGGPITALGPTFGSTPTTLPINCVNWYQAVAYCASMGKRLPTQAEWQYEAVGRTAGFTYPWGDAPTPTDCSLAIWLGDGGLTGNNGCGFPLPVGSAPKGKSIDGALDIEGSLEEWIWDASSFQDNTPWPVDYAGTPEDAGSPDGRDIRGGSWISPLSSLQPIIPANEVETTFNTNLGFRCVKTVL